MKKFALLITLCFFTAYSNQNIKTTYAFSPDPIDVIIPCHAKDKRTLDLVIEGIAKNGKKVRRIMIISAEPLSDLAEWVPEDIFPFSKQDLIHALAKEDEQLIKKVSKSSRIGWVYQQLLKLYAPFVIEGISPNVLALDADTVFLNPVEFMDENGEPYFNVGTEHHRPYFEHAAK